MSWARVSSATRVWGSMVRARGASATRLGGKLRLRGPRTPHGRRLCDEPPVGAADRRPAGPAIDRGGLRPLLKAVVRPPRAEDEGRRAGPDEQEGGARHGVQPLPLAIPTAKPIVGLMNCRKPITEKGRRRTVQARAPAAPRWPDRRRPSTGSGRATGRRFPRRHVQPDHIGEAWPGHQQAFHEEARLGVRRPTCLRMIP